MNFKEYELSIGNGYMAGDRRVKIQFPVKNSTRFMSYFLGEGSSNMFVVAEEDSARSAFQRFVMTNIFKWYRPNSVRFKVITAAMDYVDNFYNGIPVTLAPHTQSIIPVMGLSSYDNIVFALTNLRNEMTVIKQLLGSELTAAKYNTFNVAKISHTVVFLDKILEYVETLSEKEIETVMRLLQEILELSDKVNYHIIVFESKLSERVATLDLFKNFQHKIAMKSSPESSRLLIGTDIACTIGAGSNDFYCCTNEGFVNYEVPYISDDAFYEIVRKCSWYC